MVSIALAFDATAGIVRPLGLRRRIPLATRNSSTLDQTDTLIQRVEGALIVAHSCVADWPFTCDQFANTGTLIVAR